MKIAVLGAGAWGTALALAAAARHDTLLWARDAAQAARSQSERPNRGKSSCAGTNSCPQFAPVMMREPPLAAAACCCCWASNMAWKLTSVSRIGGKPARVQTSETIARRYG